jgi:hypothetical protein
MYEPAVKRTVAFIDGQNLFRSVRVPFDHIYPPTVGRVQPANFPSEGLT